MAMTLNKTFLTNTVMASTTTLWIEGHIINYVSSDSACLIYKDLHKGFAWPNTVTIGSKQIQEEIKHVLQYIVKMSHWCEDLCTYSRVEFYQKSSYLRALQPAHIFQMTYICC